MNKLCHIKIKLDVTGLNFLMDYITFEQNKVLETGVIPELTTDV